MWVVAAGTDLYASTVAHVRSVCDALPGVREESAWVGTRWVAGPRATFAHVVEVLDGYPPSYAQAAATGGPDVVLVVRSTPAEIDALTAAPGFSGPLFGRADLAVRLGPVAGREVARDELAELIVESYRLRAPVRLRRLLES